MVNFTTDMEKAKVICTPLMRKNIQLDEKMHVFGSNNWSLLLHQK